MNVLYKYFALLCASIVLMPFLAVAQCSNQITVSYYEGNTLVNKSTSDGSNSYTLSVCPSAGARYTFNGFSDADAVLSWSRVISRDASNPANDVVRPLSTATAAAGTKLNVIAGLTTTTTLRLEANASAYPQSTCTDDNYFYLTITPALTLTANVTKVCAGGAATLTASGSTDGVYTWLADGQIIDGESDASITVNPAATTVYSVRTNTSCGVSSQRLTIRTYEVAIAPSAPTLCAGQSTTLTASYTGAGATYQWFQQGSIEAMSSAASVTVTPSATTTYQVVATTTDCGTITEDVTVTVGPTTLSVAAATATVCAGGSATLTASSNNPNATFTWSPDETLSARTGATVTASPTATTTYTVSTTDCDGNTLSKQVTVAVATAATFAVSPSAATICAGSSTTFTASSNITAATYQWYRTSDLNTILTTDAALTISPTATTTYRVLTTTACGTSSQDVTVTVNQPPTVVASPSSASISRGGAVTLRAGGANTYSWSPAAGLSATTGSSVVASPTTTTTYTVIGTITSTGCINATQVTVTVTQPLPVGLISFNAAWAAGGPVLNWATASEVNNAYFSIERSTDGVAFEAVGRRLGAGTSATRVNYQFVDADLPYEAGATCYYRLRQVDLDGTIAFTPVRSVVAPGGAGTFKAMVFPNPTAGAATVQFKAPAAGAVTLTVHSVLGQALLTQVVAATPGVQQVELPELAALPAGVYYLTIGQNGQQQVVQLSRR